VVFLLVTLFLSLWLGLQALDAARSHRRTAEGAMADYAGIAVWEYSRLARENLDNFSRWLFDDIPRTVRRRPPSPEVMANDLRGVTRAQGCDCRALREGAWFFRVDLRDSTVVSEPHTVPALSLGRLKTEVLARRESIPNGRNSIIVLEAGLLSESPTMVVYQVARSWEDEDLLAYGVVAEVDGGCRFSARKACLCSNPRWLIPKPSSLATHWRGNTGTSLWKLPSDPTPPLT
jgi:hypothetical protein